MLAKLLAVVLVATLLCYLGLPIWVAWIACVWLGYLISRSYR